MPHFFPKFNLSQTPRKTPKTDDKKSFVVLDLITSTPSPQHLIFYEEPPRVTKLTTHIDEKCNSIKLTPSPGKTASIQQLITLHNHAQTIRNAEKFGPVTNETILITIQVHNRISYLTHLIESLKDANDIQKVLLIFSHDVYDDRINDMVVNIDFCMTMQIFYPFPIQTHFQTFPGDDPKDCARDLTRAEARKLECQNAEFSDMYGHYREAKFTQMKHHWWWKLNRIFDQLDATRYHTGYLLLLEEDYFVAEDFLAVMKLLQSKMLETCHECNLGSIGTYKQLISGNTFDVMDVSPWITSDHNMGMFLNKTTWNKIRNCSNFFCEYDEYNYDFSLQNINRKCLKEKLVVAFIRGPRVYHLGECGIHHQTKDCNADDKVKAVKKSLINAKKRKFLFPKQIKSGYFNSRQPTNSITPNGGWGDERDKCLCLRMTLRPD